MTGLLIFGGTILLIVCVVDHIDRRLRSRAQPWSNATVDRDAERVRDELGSLLPSQQTSAQQGLVIPYLRRHPLS